MKLHAISSHPQLIEENKAYFGQVGYTLETLALSKERDQKIAILILFSPYFYNKKYLSTEQSWKNFLQKNNPNALFIVAGFSKVEQPNYIDLINLPMDLKNFLSNAKKSGEDWTPVNSGGLDMNDKLRRFLDGHGDESVIEALGKIYRAFKIVESEVEVHQADFEETMKFYLEDNYIINKWAELQNRWDAYTPYFGCLPFYNVFKEVDKLMRNLHPFFASACKNEALFRKFDCVGQIQQMKDHLAIIKQYVT